MQDTLVVIVTGLVGAVVLLIGAAASQFAPDDDEDEDGHTSTIEIATGDGAGHGNHQGMGDTLKTSYTSDPEKADIQIGVSGTLDPSHSKKRRQSQKFIEDGPKQCIHCGSLNDSSTGPCWSCGSRPDATFTSDSIDAVNKQLRETPVDPSCLARTPSPEEHKRRRSPGSLTDLDAARNERDERRKQETTEEDIRREKEIPIHHKMAGRALGWLDKWKTLIETHARSLMIVTSIATSVWGLSVIYGALTFSSEGTNALIIAVLIAIVSATVGTLCFLAPGRIKTLALGYPFLLNVFLLPPVVIAIYDPRLELVLEQSVLLAEFLLTSYASAIGVEQWLRRTFTLEGASYLLMWFSLSFPLGWAMGLGTQSLRAVVNHSKGLMASRGKTKSETP